MKYGIGRNIALGVLYLIIIICQNEIAKKNIMKLKQSTLIKTPKNSCVTAFQFWTLLNDQAAASLLQVLDGESSTDVPDYLQENPRPVATINKNKFFYIYYIVLNVNVIVTTSAYLLYMVDLVMFSFLVAGEFSVSAITEVGGHDLDITDLAVLVLYLVTQNKQLFDCFTTFITTYILLE
ncbi:hypothetical protein MAR_029124 [Mya arenaria]|uniref:Uncharacterized protein n=1 Tax=Mya arenaria TaxID=6604 RepID=A0ABY7DFG3_MYAAR|nr:hypothetical protein MAR_029124 [Mya arenaria]